MKNLILIRHAKSSWKETGLSDFARPLNKRGEQDAPRMAKRLLQRGLVADTILASPALRAITTATIFAQETGFALDKISTQASIYESSVNNLFYLVQQLNEPSQCAYLVGHNPGMGGLAQVFAPSIVQFPTCALAHFTFDVQHWSDVKAEHAKLAYFDFPKNQLDL